MLYWFLRMLGIIFSRIFFRLEVKGVENVPRRGPVILAANHRSFLDPPLVGLMLPRRATFVSKITFYRYPHVRLIIRQLGVIPLRQLKGAVGTVSAMRSLKKGFPLVIFPEGTRNATGQPFLPGQPGVAFLADGSGAPVVPVYLDGTNKALPVGGRWFRPRRIRVIYGRPMSYYGGGYREFAEKVMEAIAKLSEQPW